MSEELLEIMEKYLANTLPADEVKDFESRVLENEELANQLQIAIHAKAAIDAQGHERMTKDLEKLGRKLIKEEVPTQVRKINWVRWSAIAAAIVLLLAIGFSLLFNEPSVAPKELYAANFEVLAAPGFRGESADDFWKEGVLAYADENYSQAIQLWESMPQESFTPETNLYLGMCYLKGNQPQKALSNFANVKSGSSAKPRAEWYTALAHLQSENVPEAKKALKKIAENSSHYKQTAAQEILEKLD